MVTRTYAARKCRNLLRQIIPCVASSKHYIAGMKGIMVLVAALVLSACGDNVMTNRQAAELLADEGCRRKAECDTLYIGSYEACFESLLIGICRDFECDDRPYVRADALEACIAKANMRTCDEPNFVCGL